MATADNTPAASSGSAALQAALGLTAETPNAQAVTEALGLRNFSSTLLSLTGAADRDAALGTIQAWKDGAAQAATLSAKVDELTAAAESAERKQLIDTALADKKLTPAQAADGAFAQTVPLATLRAYLATAPRVIPTATASASKRLVWNEMTGPQRAELYQNDPETYLSLRREATGR